MGSSVHTSSHLTRTHETELRAWLLPAPRLPSPHLSESLLLLLWSRFLPESFRWMRRRERSALSQSPSCCAVIQAGCCLQHPPRSHPASICDSEKSVGSLDTEGFYFSFFHGGFLLCLFSHQSVEWSALSPLGRFHFSMGTAVSKRKNLRSDAISSVAAKVR